MANIERALAQDWLEAYVRNHVLDTLAGNVRTVVLLHPTVEFDEILEYILSELGIPTEGGRKLVLLQRLHEFLVEHTRAGGNVALLIDEAQDLAPAVLEELRLLSNLETGTEKILQIVLAGQPELIEYVEDISAELPLPVFGSSGLHVTDRGIL
jgi:type II secretory pathway predicted ATPase ExeA